MRALFRFFAAALFLLAGCATVPAEKALPDRMSAPPAWRNPPWDALAANGREWRGPSDNTPWWQGFSDEGLMSLVERAVAGNNDLAVVASRLASANALARAAASERRPLVGFEASSVRQRTPKARMAGMPEGGNWADSMPFTANAHQGAVKAFYDLDVVGRLSRAEAGAAKAAQAVQWDLDAARLRVVHAVVTTYTDFRYAEAVLHSVVERKTLCQELLDIEQARAQAGLVPLKAVRDAEATLSETNREEAVLTRELEGLRAQLAVLVGEPPQSFSLQASNKLPTAIGVPPDVPAEVLAHRPDLRAAWARVEAAGVDVELVDLERFPRITLTGALGFASSALSGFLRKDALAWLLGVGVGAPLFDGGRIQARVEQERANLEGAVAGYRQSVLVALRDVEQSLAALNAASRARGEARNELDRAARAEHDARREYAVGRTGKWALAKERIHRKAIEGAFLESERILAMASADVFFALGR